VGHTGFSSIKTTLGVVLDAPYYMDHYESDNTQFVMAQHQFQSSTFPQQEAQSFQTCALSSRFIVSTNSVQHNPRISRKYLSWLPDLSLPANKLLATTIDHAFRIDWQHDGKDFLGQSLLHFNRNPFGNIISIVVFPQNPEAIIAMTQLFILEVTFLVYGGTWGAGKAPVSAPTFPAFPEPLRELISQWRRVIGSHASDVACLSLYGTSLRIGACNPFISLMNPD